MTNFFRRFTASQYFCEDIFEGGGWALVRRVRQGTTWQPATDALTGTSVYGTYAASISSDSTFSVPFASLITSQETLFLFATGTLDLSWLSDVGIRLVAFAPLTFDQCEPWPLLPCR